MRLVASRQRESCPAAYERRAAFTLIELLVVIAIIIVLTGILVGISTKAVDRHKRTVTTNIMRTVEMAIDQFKGEDPLGAIYNNRRANRETFGPYPPYQLAGAPAGNQNTVTWAVEPNPPGSGNDLANRLGRDLLRIPENQLPPSAQIVDIQQDNRDDIRALYAYLRVLTPAALAQVPEEARKPLGADVEFINTSYDPQTQNANAAARTEVLGIHDAWGVPLDYFLYVKLEWSPDPTGASAGILRVTDRVPVLRSRGVTKEVLGSPKDEGERWIYSQPFPTPPADVDPDNGALNAQNTASNGWARARAQGDGDYRYVPPPAP